MPKIKFTCEQISQIRQFLVLGHSSTQIQKAMKLNGVDISSRYIRNIRLNMVRPPKDTKIVKKRGPKFKLNSMQMTNLRKYLKKPNPPRISWLANHYKLAKSSIINYKSRFGLKKYAKPKRHLITESSREKRALRSWPLYKQLCNRKWLQFITCDESIFYLDGSYNTRDFQYLGDEDSRLDIQVRQKQSHPKSIMVWIAFCAFGFLKPIFVEPKAKVNANYYIENILKPMSKEADSIFKGRNWILHQDSAPAHTAKITQKFLQDSKIRYVKPTEWLPNSPDCAPCDFWLFGYLKRKLRERNIRSVQQLKRGITSVLSEIPLETIHRVLQAWPRRLRQVYSAKGGHIEGFKAVL